MSLIGAYILGADELIIVSLEQSHCLIEISNLILVGIFQNILVLHQIFRNHQVMIHHKPHLMKPVRCLPACYRKYDKRRNTLPGNSPSLFCTTSLGVCLGPRKDTRYLSLISPLTLCISGLSQLAGGSNSLGFAFEWNLHKVIITFSELVIFLLHFNVMSDSR